MGGVGSAVRYGRAVPRLREHFPHNVMEDPDEIAHFHEVCSDYMRALLAALAAAPDQPRPFPVIEDAMGWPRRRIASVLGGVSHLRHTRFGGRRPYRFLDDRVSPSRRWELWVDADQARAIRAAQRDPA
jgi:hypothetical protein